MVNYVDILNRWFVYSKFNPNQTSFNSSVDNFRLHQCNEFVIKITEEYDPTGILALIYIKNVIRDLFKQIELTAYDIITQPNLLSEEQQIWSLFFNPEIDQVENDFIDGLNQISNQVIKKPLIGEINYAEQKQSLFDCIQNVVEHLNKLNVDVFLSSNQPINNIQNFSTHITVFNTLRDCLLKLEQARDGIYLSYISEYNTAGGYFSFFIKNNGNIVSINERVNEMYPGEHKRCRNTRWSEDKQYELFPYSEIFKFDQYDYKGYPTKHIIDESQLDFLELKPETYNTIILSMVLLSNKFSNKTFSTNDVKIVNSMLPINVQAAIENSDKQSTEITLYQNSNIILSHKQYNFSFDLNKVLSGEYSKEYSNDNNDKTYNERGYFQNINQLLVDLYGEGFTINNEDLIKTDITRILTCSDYQNDPNYIPDSEYIGNSNQINLQCYFNIRKQLAQYIKNKQNEEYAKFGGVKALKKWYTDLITKNIKIVYDICMQLSIDLDKEDNTNASANVVVTDSVNKPYSYKCEWNTFSLSKCSTYINWVQKDCRDNGKYHYDWCGADIVLNDTNGSDFYCPITQTRGCYYWFRFRPVDWINIEKIFNTKVPKFMCGWRSDSYEKPYTGNSILNVVDPVDRLETPINNYNITRNTEGKCNMCFIIGFSKRGFNQLMKQYKKEHGGENK